jgi:GT2 family glycosyltransferase
MSIPRISAVIITRHRPEMLKRTLNSFQQMTYPVSEVVVTDDITNEDTLLMLKREYPEVIHVWGPRTGIAANRNNGIRAATGDYILLLDDDIFVDPNFLEGAFASGADLSSTIFFAALLENEVVVLPRANGFLGFHTRLHVDGEPWRNLNGQAILAAKPLFTRVPFDEAISLYGYEEVEYAYRVTANGYKIHLLTQCTHHHLDQKSSVSQKDNMDAARLYVTYKARARTDQKKMMGLIFLSVAIPHHLLAMIKRRGLRGVPIAVSNVRWALKTIRATA